MIFNLFKSLNRIFSPALLPMVFLIELWTKIVNLDLFFVLTFVCHRLCPPGGNSKIPGHMVIVESKASVHWYCIACEPDTHAKGGLNQDRAAVEA